MMQLTHRGSHYSIVRGLLAGLAIAICGESLMAKDTGKAMTPAELRQARERAVRRRRRIIFNNDGNEPVYYLREATAKAFLDCRTTPLVGSQVDAIFYCTWSSGFSFFTHNTKAGQVFDTTANPKHPQNKTGGFSKNKTAEFIQQGTDPLKMMVAFCRKNGIEIFWSFRMNDTHDAWGGWYSPYLFPKLKTDHPEWLVASKAKRSRHGGWSAVDYARKEIRDLAVTFVEEVCENYDVDGIEMDFFRHPVFFKGPAHGKDAGQKERDLMTGMVRRVRKTTEAAGLKRGRPILVAVRVPDSVGYCNAAGLDIVRWLEEGLIDLMAVSGYFRLSPWETSVRLGHKYGVPVYPCLSETRMRDAQARKARASLACYRARAANVWQAGADGVYLFNFFNPRSGLWRQVGDPRGLERMDKVYVVGARGVTSINRWMANGERRFLSRPKLSPERPIALRPGQTESVELRVAERIPKAPAGGPLPEVTLRLRVQKLAQATDLAVQLNAKPLARPSRSGVWLEYAVDPAYLNRGATQVAVTLQPTGRPGPILQDVLLRVRYRKTP